MSKGLDIHFVEVQNIIILHRARALKAVHEESLMISWNVGQYISEKLQKSEWGSKVVTRLSKYLRIKNPDLKGYSRRNLYNMVRFYETYSSVEFIELCRSFRFPRALVQDETAQKELVSNKENQIVQFETAQIYQPRKYPAILGKLNWTSHVEILNTCRTDEERLFYILYANRENLEVKELRRAIKTNAYNMILKYEDMQSVGMHKAYPRSGYLFKDVAYLDFLGLPHTHSEYQLKTGILELGKDFLFMGKEYPLNVGGKKYKIDLLFFHRGLQCLVGRIQVCTVSTLNTEKNEFKFCIYHVFQLYKESLYSVHTTDTVFRLRNIGELSKLQKHGKSANSFLNRLNTVHKTDPKLRNIYF